jgi:hypothetical protein
MSSVIASNNPPTLPSFLGHTPLEKRFPDEELLKRLFTFIDWKTRGAMSQVSIYWHGFTFFHSVKEFAFLNKIAGGLSERFASKIPEESENSFSRCIAINHTIGFRTFQDVRLKKDELSRHITSCVFAYLDQGECDALFNTRQIDVLFSARFQLSPFEWDVYRCMKLVASAPVLFIEDKRPHFIKCLIKQICAESAQPIETLDFAVQWAREILDADLKKYFIHRTLLSLLSLSKNTDSCCFYKAIDLAVQEYAEGGKCRKRVMVKIWQMVAKRLFRDILLWPFPNTLFSISAEDHKLAAQFVRLKYIMAKAMIIRGKMTIRQADLFLLENVKVLAEYGYKEEAAQLALHIEDVRILD